MGPHKEDMEYRKAFKNDNLVDLTIPSHNELASTNQETVYDIRRKMRKNLYDKARYDPRFIGAPDKKMLFASIYEPNVEPDYNTIGLRFEQYV